MKHSETLHDRAVSNFNVAKFNFRQRDSDEFYLNVTGYFLQQAVEFEIKHRIEVAGIKYPFIHNIEELLDSLTQTTEYSNEQLRNIAPELSKWESKTWYLKGYFLTEQAVLRAFPIVEEFLNEITNEF